MRDVLICVGIVVMGACGDSGAGVCSRDGGAACFDLPTDAMAAYGPGGSSPPLLLGCGAITETPATTAVAVSGHVIDYNTDQPVAGATFQLFHIGDYEGAAIATATSDASGAYSMNLPSGTPDLLSGAISGGALVPELRDQLRPDLSGATVKLDFTTATADVLDLGAQYVDVARDPSLAQVWVYVYDCNRNPIINAVVVLSTTSGKRDFVASVPVFYSGGDVLLPHKHSEAPVTGPEGAAVALDVPLDGTIYVQAWGFPDQASATRGDPAGLELVAERAVLRRAGAITLANLWAN